MEQVSKGLLVHQTHVVYAHQSPQTVRSRDGNGIQLNGLNQYLDAGKDIICKNDLHNCERGFTLRFELKPFQLADQTYFISSAPVDVYYRYVLQPLCFHRAMLRTAPYCYGKSSVRDVEVGYRDQIGWNTSKII